MRTILCAAMALLAMAEVGRAEVVHVELEPAVVRNIGGVTKFDRNQFITIHESPDAGDMKPEDFRKLSELDVRFGRNGGALSWQATRIPADPQNGDMPNVEKMKQLAEKHKKKQREKKLKAADEREVVYCTHPEHMHAMLKNHHAPWGPRTYEGIAEYTAQYLKHYFTDKNRPKYLEVFNEPFVKSQKMGTTIEALSEQHNHVARRVRELCPEVKVGGYSAAWFEVELKNFWHWDTRQKTFMDIAGEEMDFFSYHIYDGVNVKGEPRIRTGSNSEAIMDLVDTYSAIKFGVAKPILITEYGGIPANGNSGMSPTTYSAKRSAGMLYSLAGQLMTYMDHPDCLDKVIPYILGRAEWTYGDAQSGEANPFLLWRRTEEGSYVETDLMLFYELWKDFNGEWRKSSSSNPDVRVQLLADKNRLILTLMNLDQKEQRVKLSGLEGLDAQSVKGRFLFTDGETPKLGERSLGKIPPKLTLRPGATVMVLVELAEPIEPESMVREYRVYATDYLQDIQANRPVRFEFQNVPTGAGTMFIRLSSGRELGREKLPKSVRFNGKAVRIPNNWAGGDQAGRKNYFGMIEIPVPIKHAKPVSVVEVTYPDTGGKTAAVVLQVNREESL